MRASFEALNDNAPENVKETDLNFLKGLIESPVVQNLLKVQEKLENTSSADLLRDSCDALDESLENCDILEVYHQVKVLCSKMSSRNSDARTLHRILENPHVEALVQAHDNVMHRAYDDTQLEESFEMDLISDAGERVPLTSAAIRMVGIRKALNEPLGMTVKIDDGYVVVARILAGGLVDKQGLLHVGDIILEVNGQQIDSPEQLQEHMKRADESITFKISPSSRDTPPASSCFMRALYTYDPNQDKLLPCKEVGVAFKQGDILEVLNQEDPNWWQARHVDTPGSSTNSRAGLIPSQDLEERRRAFVRPEFDYATKTSICGTKVTKKKKKEMYYLQSNSEFDKAELCLYEEVCRTPPFERRTLILLGAQGIGRNSLKTKLSNYDPKRFAIPLPHTSRPIREGEIDGQQYYFVTREVMEKDIAEGKYLEYGEYQDHLYGTKLDTIKDCIASGKMAIIDCNPQVR